MKASSGWIEPMEPALSTVIVEGNDWIHEVKWDGIRGLSYIQDGRLSVFTKRRIERTAFYPELAELTALLDARQAVLDGEIVVFDSEGNPSFYSSLVRERVRDAGKVRYYSELYPAHYIIFDIMCINGKDLTSAPLKERKEILAKAVGRSGNITRTDSFTDGVALYELMKLKSWEGIVSKRKDSRYTGGKTHGDWFKTKLSRKLLAVVGGLQWKSGTPNSLLLGIYEGGVLVYIGKAGLGLSGEQTYLLGQESYRLARSECPFVTGDIPAGKGNITWLVPKLTCWVHFMEFTNDGLMRHPKILGFSASKPAEADGKEYVD